MDKLKSFTIDKDILEEKIIDRENLTKFIRQTSRELNFFREEIEWWFNIFKKSQNPFQRNYLKKPICIELYEYTNILNMVSTKINTEIIPIVNEVFTKNNRQSPVDSLDRNIKKELKIIREMLTDPRNKVVAHRYTNKDGQYITIGELIRYMDKLTGKNLQDIKDKLFSIHDELVEWIDQHESFILLADYKKK